jgi:polyisoprenoid-binding protein YceI
MRDKHLKSDDYFDAEMFPKMTFESSGFKKEGDVYLATGNLTIKGTKKEVTFRMQLKEKALVMKTTINADDFDVSPKSREKSTVHVTVTVPLNE